MGATGTGEEAESAMPTVVERGMPGMGGSRARNEVGHNGGPVVERRVE